MSTDGNAIPAISSTIILKFKESEKGAESSQPETQDPFPSALLSLLSSDGSPLFFQHFVTQRVLWPM